MTYFYLLVIAACGINLCASTLVTKAEYDACLVGEDLDGNASENDFLPATLVRLELGRRGLSSHFPGLREVTVDDMYAIQHKKTKQWYAGKRKKLPESPESTEISKAGMEITTLKCMRGHQFICKLHFYWGTVRNNNYHYDIIMELASGGTLANLLMSKDQTKLDEEDAKFYAIQIVYAVSYINSLGIVHRKLTPDSVFLDEDGYVKLCSFGCSVSLQDEKEIQMIAGDTDRCGTEIFDFYHVPEFKNYKNFDTKADAFAVGALIVAMVNGRYNSEKRITDIPANFSASLKDLLGKLLVVDQSKRSNVEAIKEHSWLKTSYLNDILTKKAKAPFVPIIEGKMQYYQDTRNSEIKHKRREQKRTGFQGFGPIPK